MNSRPSTKVKAVALKFCKEISTRPSIPFYHPDELKRRSQRLHYWTREHSNVPGRQCSAWPDTRRVARSSYSIFLRAVGSTSLSQRSVGQKPQEELNGGGVGQIGVTYRACQAWSVQY